MWTKRKEEEFTPRPSFVPPSPPDLGLRGEATPVSTPSVAAKSAEPEMPRGVAAIGKSVVIKGQLFSREDLYLDGEMEGTVEVPEHRLTIGPYGKLQASVRAREVVVLGSISGNVEAGERIDIRKDARLVGDIKTGRIIIEDGAYFKGSIDIVKAEAGQAAPAARPQPAPSTGTAAAVAEGVDPAS